jgi:DNA polymerase-1
MKLPNVRKLFVPDKGFVLLDADLSGADAQVVAWEANDSGLKAAFRSGIDIHSKNAEEMWGDDFRALKGFARKAKRQTLKTSVHATNYGAAARTLALNPAIGFTYAEAEWFQERWFSLHPGIKEWHMRTRDSLFASRSVHNAFGYRIIYFDRIDSLLPQALAWIPQSTVAEVCFRGALQLERELSDVEMLLQVHDSIVFQIPEKLYEPSTLSRIKRALEVPIPYPDPLVIRWKLAASPISWGDTKELSL